MEHKGTVYFFTGLSGAGKTTVGSLFYRRLKNTKPNAVYLDGDEIRVAFGEDVGYTNDERLRWAGRIFRVCKLLSDQGIDVVCCSIAMYQSIRAWNRANIPNYKEIYLRVKPETLLARNQKGLYTGGHNVVGVDLPFDEPKTPDLIIQNDGERTPLEAVEEIERVLYPNIVENPIDNRDYWNRYYQDGLCPMDPSPFARYAATLVEPGRTLVDLGCGNGRDEEFGRWDRDASGALRYTSLVPAQRNPRFSDSDFWKIYITTNFFSENTDGACGNRKESADTFHKYCFARAIISYNAVNLSHL